MASFNIRVDDKSALLELSGELTIEHAGELRDELLAIIGSGSDVRIDLSEVTELDLACAQTLISALKSSAARSAALDIFGLNGKAASAAGCGGFSFVPPSAVVSGGSTGGSDEQEDNDS